MEAAVCDNTIHPLTHMLYLLMVGFSITMKVLDSLNVYAFTIHR